MCEVGTITYKLTKICCSCVFENGDNNEDELLTAAVNNAYTILDYLAMNLNLCDLRIERFVFFFQVVEFTFSYLNSSFNFHLKSKCSRSKFPLRCRLM